MKETETGTIIKGIGGFYSVLCGGEVYVCKARGLFRKQRRVPVVGDNVKFERSGNEGYLLDILPRKNELIRPAAANIDKLFIVAAASRPEPDLMLADKLAVRCEKLGIRPVFVINKCDDAPADAVDALAAQYEEADYPVYRVSAAAGTGLEELKKEFAGSVVCLAGQSAVGKSSLLNAMMPELGLAVGGLSQKTERGRHTTRHAEMIPLPECGGAVMDTPGFSLLDSVEVEPEEIKNYYPELRKCRGECRFSGCLHIKEPGCFVRRELLGNGLDKERYARYVRLVNEAFEIRRHKYD